MSSSSEDDVIRRKRKRVEEDEDDCDCDGNEIYDTTDVESSTSSSSDAEKNDEVLSPPNKRSSRFTRQYTTSESSSEQQTVSRMNSVDSNIYSSSSAGDTAKTGKVDPQSQTLPAPAAIEGDAVDPVDLEYIDMLSVDEDIDEESCADQSDTASLSSELTAPPSSPTSSDSSRSADSICNVSSCNKDTVKLFNGSENSVNDVCVGITQFSEKHNLSNVAVQDLLILLNNILPEDHQMPGTSFLFNKEVSMLYEGYTEIKSPTQKSSLFLFDIDRQLQAILTENWDDVMKKREQLMTCTREDVAAMFGTIYAEHMDGISIEDCVMLSLVMYIDSAPVFKKAGGSIYFILGQILELPPSQKLSDYNTIILGVCSGNEKYSHDFLLNDVVNNIEMHKHFNLPISIKNNINLHLWVHSVLADLPGKAFICNHKQFNGKFGCSLCLHPGSLLIPTKPKRVWPFRENVPLRTVDMVAEHSLRMQLNKNPAIKSIFGIKGDTPLNKIINIPLQIPLDPMHLVDEGAFKKVLELLFVGKYSDEKFSLRKHRMDINQLLSDIKTPHEVHRSFKIVTDQLKGLKASEFRFLLHHGLPTLKHYLPEPYFSHIISLSMGIKYLSQTKIIIENVEEARTCLRYFCTNFEKFYGLAHCSYNIHGILHLIHQVPIIGPLHTVSGYPFESTIGVVKRHCHGSKNVTEQTAKFVAAHKNILCYFQEKVKAKEHTILNKVSTFKRKRSRISDLLGSCRAILPYITIKLDVAYKMYLCESPVLLNFKEEILSSNELITVNKIVKQNQVIHSLSYKRVQNSCSYMIGWKVGIHSRYGICERFFILNNILFADVTEFKIRFFKNIASHIVTIGHFIAVENLNHNKTIVLCDDIFGKVVFSPCVKKGNDSIIGYLTNLSPLEHD